jgi:hypothetical protein
MEDVEVDPTGRCDVKRLVAAHVQRVDGPVDLNLETAAAQGFGDASQDANLK